MGKRFDKFDRMVTKEANKLAKKTGREVKELERGFWKAYNTLPKNQRKAVRNIGVLYHKRVPPSLKDSIATGLLGTGLVTTASGGNIIVGLMVGGVAFGLLELKEGGIKLINFIGNSAVKLEKAIAGRKKKKLWEIT